MYLFPPPIREKYCGSAIKGKDVVEMVGYVQLECWRQKMTEKKLSLSESFIIKNNSEQRNSLMPCCKWLFFHVLPPWLVLGSERTGLPFPPPVPQAAICPPGNRDHLDHHHPCHHHHHHHPCHHASGTNPSPKTVIIWIICRTKYIDLHIHIFHTFEVQLYLYFKSVIHM